jgi:hypothetical protein
MSKTADRKKAMLAALEKSLGTATSACRIVGIERRTHYNWLESDPAYKKAVDDIQDIALDFVELRQFERIKEGSDTLIKNYLNTKGRRRGYTEHIEHGGEIATPTIISVRTEELDDFLAKLKDKENGRT